MQLIGGKLALPSFSSANLFILLAEKCHPGDFDPSFTLWYEYAMSYTEEQIWTFINKKVQNFEQRWATFPHCD